MYRRRRPRREIEFSFDSFLDVVANVVGIILRLILVAWVGAKAYKACVPPAPPRPVPAFAEPEAPPGPYDPRVERFADIRARIEQENAARSAKEKEAEAARGAAAALASGLADVAGRQARLKADAEALAKAGAARRAAAQAAKLSTAELEARSKALMASLEELRKLPPRRKELRYRTPVSADVQEEVMFECRGGRVTLIDREQLEKRMNDDIRERLADLRRSGALSGTTGPVGSFRLRYHVERVAESIDGRLDGGWVLEPVDAVRGEAQGQALADGSVFRRVVDHLDPDLKAVTLWVYPDSFPLYRALRDHMHGRNIVVAGRPLQEHGVIGSSSKGTVSRGQ